MQVDRHLRVVGHGQKRRERVARRAERTMPKEERHPQVRIHRARRRRREEIRGSCDGESLAERHVELGAVEEHVGIPRVVREHPHDVVVAVRHTYPEGRLRAGGPRVAREPFDLIDRILLFVLPSHIVNCPKSNARIVWNEGFRSSKTRKE